MRKLRIIIPLAMAVAAVGVISFSVVLAQGNEGSDSNASNASKLAIKVAEILGMEAEVVDDAITQARKELRNEALQNKLNALVEKGQLTQKQADEHFNWIQSRPEGDPAIGRDFLKKNRHHRAWKRHPGSFGPRNYFKKEAFYGNDQKKLNAMLERGEITQEELEAKLKWLQITRTD